MQHPTQFMFCFIFSRVPIEFPNKNFFTGKLESLCYSIYRRDLFLNGSSVVMRPTFARCTQQRFNKSFQQKARNITMQSCPNVHYLWSSNRVPKLIQNTHGVPVEFLKLFFRNRIRNTSFITRDNTINNHERKIKWIKENKMKQNK